MAMSSSILQCATSSSSSSASVFASGFCLARTASSCCSSTGRSGGTAAAARSASSRFQALHSRSLILGAPLHVQRRKAVSLIAGGLTGLVTSFGSSTRTNMASAETSSLESFVDFTKNDHRRMLHVVYRVGNLDNTIKFYTEALGMKLLRKRDIPEEKYTNAFLGYGPEATNFVVELTYNYGVDSYDIGTGFGHFGIAVDDVYKKVELIKSKGGKVTREPGPVKGGQTVIAFVEDPDGYKFELLQRPATPEPFAQVCLRVGDMDKAIAFYEKAFGMKLMSKKDRPEYKYTNATLGYGDDESKTTVVELTYNYGVSEYTKGTGYAQLALSTDDVFKTADAVKAFGGEIARKPGPIPGINTKVCGVLDPDGWKSVFVDNADFAKELE